MPAEHVPVFRVIAAWAAAMVVCMATGLALGHYAAPLILGTVAKPMGLF